MADNNFNDLQKNLLEVDHEISINIEIIDGLQI